MNGIEKRLTKLEAASGHTAQTVVVFVSFVPGPDLHDTATVDGRVWRREPDEVEEQVTLQDETVVIDRRPVTGGQPVAEFTDKTIEMTETHEEPVVSKTRA